MEEEDDLGGQDEQDEDGLDADWKIVAKSRWT
jgi:hypothetical protein